MSALPCLHPIDLRSEAGALLLHEVAEQASSRLAAMAGRLARIFAIRSPFAPGLFCIGGEAVLDGEAAAADGASRLSVTGNGETPCVAFASCFGETADLLSQFERNGDVAARRSARELPEAVAHGWLASAGVEPDRPLDWIAAVEAGAGTPVFLPADLCLRRTPDRRVVAPVGALSSGAAAGPDKEAAALRAVLELCERDAAALWWLGGRRPRRFAPDHPAEAAGVALVRRLRRDAEGRRTLLLDITTDLGVPAVAALSMDKEGRGLACGVAARLDAADAARAAILEMCQMELSAPVAAAKLAERGEAGLNDADRRHLRRAAFRATDSPLLEADGLSGFGPGGASDFGSLVRHLGERGIRIFLADLSRKDLGIAVMRAVSPDLQPYSPAVETMRLKAALAGGNGGKFVADMSLF